MFVDKVFLLRTSARPEQGTHPYGRHFKLISTVVAEWAGRV